MLGEILPYSYISPKLGCLYAPNCIVMCLFTSGEFFPATEDVPCVAFEPSQGDPARGTRVELVLCGCLFVWVVWF